MTSTTVVAAQTMPCRPNLGAVPLPAYAAIVGIQEEAFWGIERDIDFQEKYAIWTLRERCMLAHYLDEAQERIEDELGYPLSPRWFNDDLQYSCFLVLKRGKIIEAGVEAATAIETGAALTTGGDPYYLTVTTDVTDESEIRVYYPTSEGVEAQEVEINPSDIDLDTVVGQATIYIPRCRCVKIDYVQNPDHGWDYDDETYFLDEVDVYRVYNDSSENAELVYPHRSSCLCPRCTVVCGEYVHDACVYLRNEELGIIDVLRASYTDADGWTACCTSSCGEPERVRVYYKAGPATLSHKAQTAVIRLAHTLMPRMPCGCEKYVLAWERDNNIPDVMTRERVNNPLGLADGAWYAWAFVIDHKIRRISTL